MPAAKYFDEFGDMVRKLVGAGMTPDAAETVARAAKTGVPQKLPGEGLGYPADFAAQAPVRQLELPISSLDSVPTRPAIDVATAARSMDAGVPQAPNMELGSPLWGQMDKGARAYDNLAKGRTANLRNQNPDFVRIAQQNINTANQSAAASRAAQAAAGENAALAAKVGLPAAATVAGVYATSQMPNGPAPATGADKPTADMVASGGEADLAEEARPAPKVSATDKDGVPMDEGKFTEMFKRQYLAREEKRKAKGQGGYARPDKKPAPQQAPADQAKAILADLNARRRKAGGEVPEAKQMMAEADRLLAQSNKQRNSPGYQPAQPSNPREQAQAMLNKLNADRMEAGGEVPHSQQVLAEVRRLQAMADAQDWRR